MRLFLSALTFQVLFLVASQRSTAGPDQSPLTQLPTLEEIITQIDKNCEKIKTGLLIEVKIEKSAGASPEDIRRLLGKVASVNGTETYAVKGGKRYSKTIKEPTKKDVESAFQRPEVDPNAPFWKRQRQKALQDQYDRVMKELKAAEEKGGLSVKDRIKKGLLNDRSKTNAFNGEVQSLYEHYGVGTITPKSRLINNSYQFLYFTSIGLYISDPTSPQQDSDRIRSGLLPNTLQKSTYRVSEDRLDGVRAIRLEGSTGVGLPVQFKDTLWLDPEHGYMVLKRELRGSNTDHLSYRATTSDFKEIKPDLWLPLKCRFVEFAPEHAPQSLQDQPLHTTLLTVTKYDLEIPDSLFDVEFPPRTRVHNFVLSAERHLPANTAVTYRVPANASQLDKVIEDAVREVQGSGLRKALWIIVANVTLVGVLLFFLRRQRRRSPQ